MDACVGEARSGLSYFPLCMVVIVYAWLPWVSKWTRCHENLNVLNLDKTEHCACCLGDADVCVCVCVCGCPWERVCVCVCVCVCDCRDCWRRCFDCLWKRYENKSDRAGNFHNHTYSLQRLSRFSKHSRWSLVCCDPFECATICRTVACPSSIQLFRMSLWSRSLLVVPASDELVHVKLNYTVRSWNVCLLTVAKTFCETALKKQLLDV